MISLTASIRLLGVTLVFAVALNPVRAVWTPPDAAQLARLERSLAPMDKEYDPAEQMIRRAVSTAGYHTTMAGVAVHHTRESLHYAVGLLDTGRPEARERAVAILRRVLALQDTDPASKTYGIWSWYLEEPLEKMNPPDWNWADFNGVTLLQVARDHRDRLPADLAQAVDDALLHICRCIKKRNVQSGYTNIAIMGAYVTAVAGELYDWPEFRNYGLERLKRFADFTRENGTFQEYNSPTYTRVALNELSRMKAHVRDADAQALLDHLVRLAWMEIASHFHAPTRQWAGPHSRAYSSLLEDRVLAIIQRGTAGRVDFGVDAPELEELRLPLACPPDLEPMFRTLDVPRTVTEVFIRLRGITGTTYLHPQFALGSVNHTEYGLWNQSRALLLHYGTADASGYLHLRFLKNGYDFASAQITSTQHDGVVVGAVTLMTEWGDTHPLLDKVKNATIRARDLRLRFELGGPAAKDARITLAPGTASASIDVGSLALGIDVLRARLDSRIASVTAGGAEGSAWFDVVLHEGEEREFNLAALEEAIIGFVFSVGPHGEATATTENGELRLRCGELSVTVPLKPGLRPL
jgi:hypothetical protein